MVTHQTAFDRFFSGSLSCRCLELTPDSGTRRAHAHRSPLASSRDRWRVSANRVPLGHWESIANAKSRQWSRTRPRSIRFFSGSLSCRCLELTPDSATRRAHAHRSPLASSRDRRRVSASRVPLGHWESIANAKSRQSSRTRPRSIGFFRVTFLPLSRINARLRDSEGSRPPLAVGEQS